jgi:hypothetical protein
VVKLACMKFIYQEMLVMAVMTHWEMEQNGLAAKLKNWFEQLGDMHSFL